MRVAVVAVVAHRGGVAGADDLVRPARVHAQRPLRDVVVVRAPVGHLAAGELVPPAELVVAVGVAREAPADLLLGLQEAVVHLGRRTQPEVPVESLRHVGLGDRRAGRVGADPGLDRLDLFRPVRRRIRILLFSPHDDRIVFRQRNLHERDPVAVGGPLERRGGKRSPGGVERHPEADAAHRSCRDQMVVGLLRFV